MDTCPKCGNSMFSEEGFDFTDFQAEGDELWDTYTCNKCGYMWHAVYKFSHFEDADTTEVIPYKE